MGDFIEVGRDRYALIDHVMLTDDAVLDYGNAIHNYAPALAAAGESGIEFV
jgi:hypothetical protein